MKQLHRLLHSLLALIFSLLVFISYYFKLIKQRLGSIFYQPTEDDIKREIATLTNLPCHISFLVLEPRINFSILARIIVWSVATGISYLSVYDPEGILKKRRVELYEEVLQMQQQLLSAQYEIHLSANSALEENMTNGTDNKKNKNVYLTVLSKEDGKEDIVKAAKKFCSSVCSNECKPKSMDVEQFSGLLEGNKGFPDPDLALKFGPTDILNGYLPWQIRLTEFISIPSLYVMDYKLLINALQKYSTCEQRLGR